MNKTLDAGYGASLTRLAERELLWCLKINRASSRRPLERMFALVSRLGDGVFWYGLMLVLIGLEGYAAVPAVSRMLLAGGLCLFIYKWLKRSTTRPRPCARTTAIHAPVAPLDEFSFPSGHTLHAVGFTVVALAHYPGLGWLLLPFTALVAASRLVLGLHYPSDVVAGALLGGVLATVVLQI